MSVMGPSTPGDWQQAEPGVFDQAVNALAATAQAIERIVDREDTAISGLLNSRAGWSGQASEEYAKQWQTQRAQLRSQVKTQRDAAGVYRQFANQLAEARTSWQRLGRDAEAIGGTLTAEGQVLLTTGPVALPDPGREEEAAAIRRQAAEVTARITEADRVAANQIYELARRDERPQPQNTRTTAVLLQAGMNGQIQNKGLLGEADPALVAAWWAALPPAVKERLTRTAPNLLRNLDGIPPEIRDQANRAAIASALAATRAQIKAKQQAREDMPYGGKGITYGNLDVDIAALEERAATFQDLLKNKDATILAFSPEGYGKVTVAIGDITTADNVAVMVPGMNTTIDSIDDHIGTAQLMKDRIGLRFGEETASNTAIVAWLDYEAPQGIPQAMSESYAREAAPELSNFTNGLVTTNEGDPNLTVLAHSYGSALAGHTAAEYGIPADNLVYFGSPGVMSSHVDQLNIAQDGEVWAGRNQWDPIPFLAADIAEGPILGHDPTDSEYGAKLFEANDSISADEAHSRYFEGESLENMARIVADHSEEVRLN